MTAIIIMMEETVSRIQRRNNSRADLQETYGKLNSFIEKLNEKIVNRIQLVQQTYLEDYNTQVKQMAEQLKTIRGVLDQQLLRQRSNERLFYLEEQRDFFRGQTMKLNEEAAALSKANAKMKAELQAIRAQSANYKQLVYGLQKKIVKVHNDAFQLEKLNKSPTKMPSLAPSKELLSISPTKTTLTRYSPANLNDARPMYKSVEFQRSTSKEGLSSELKRRQQILEQCIKDIKKRIFYRTATQSPQKLFFNEEKQITFEKFTRTDKQELIRNILSRDDMLSQFYHFMVGKKDGDKLQTRKSFINKSTFSDKIFKIKLCGMGEIS